VNGEAERGKTEVLRGGGEGSERGEGGVRRRGRGEREDEEKKGGRGEREREGKKGGLNDHLHGNLERDIESEEHS
jgi:hypothetical protein